MTICLKISVYNWEDIRKYFLSKRVAEIRARILELRESGKYTDRELWEMYGMSDCTFYDLVRRAKDGSTAEDLKDRPCELPITEQAVRQLLSVIIENLRFQFRGLKCFLFSSFYLKIELSDNL